MTPSPSWLYVYAKGCGTVAPSRCFGGLLPSKQLSQCPVFSPGPSCGWWCEHWAQWGAELFGVLFFSEVPGKQGNSSLPSALEAELVPRLSFQSYSWLQLQKCLWGCRNLQAKAPEKSKNKTSPCVSQSSPPLGLWGRSSQLSRRGH